MSGWCRFTRQWDNVVKGSADFFLALFLPGKLEDYLKQFTPNRKKGRPEIAKNNN